jgi:hypothetical protein
MMDALGFILSGAVICLAFELWERGAGRKGSMRGKPRAALRLAGLLAGLLGAALYAAVVLRRHLGWPG